MQNNYITDYIESKGFTVQECYKPAKKEVPANMRHRYSTYEEYEEALHDFLNGLWSMRIVLAAIVVIVGANMLVSILNSNMMKTIEERNTRMEKLINEM